MTRSAPEPPRPASPVEGVQFYRPKKRRIWPWVLLALGLLLLCGGAMLAAGNGVRNASEAAGVITPEPIPTPSNAPGKPKPASIGGDDVVHVGEDVPAGTYRAKAAVDNQLCYWQKSTDAEGAKIIDNGLPTGGRPEVTLKKGQWFTSQGCPEWIKK
jgi:hypothetical protein